MDRHKAKSWTGAATAPRPVGRRAMTVEGGEIRVGWLAVRCRRRPRVVCDGPRLIVSSVRRKARARPSFADSRHPRRVPMEVN